MTGKNDIVLIYFEDKPLSFARIEEIRPDWKKNWYHVKLLMLQIPLQVVTWILRDVYIDGQEFTMNSLRVRMEKITCPPDEGPDADTGHDDPPGPSTDDTGDGGKIISFTKRKT
ncbi:hypothetical protein [Desulfatiferula olefinivorans]